MIRQLAHLNWLSVTLAYPAYFVPGGLWFTLLFGKHYKRSLGRENETLPNKPVFITGRKAPGFSLLTGIGYPAADTVHIAIHPNVPKPAYYSTIGRTYYLTGMIMVNVILVAMN